MVKFIKVISWNVNGISNKVKRYKILTHLKSLSCDVAMLQETHLNESESLKLKQKWVGQVFSAPGNGASKGASILISKKLQFTSSDMTIDKDGRYVIISGLLEHKKVTLANIYAPNSGQIKFLSNLAIVLAQNKYKNNPILIGGDFNLVNDAIFDRSKRKDQKQMGNYRPLSLLNNDYKIFAKALAGRLGKAISSLVHLDQAGFIAGRNASQNMRRLFHVFPRLLLSTNQR
uniref:exodeoxyribonuclease III n=1 Tax=Neogobius melanostomus TaxID=47308 RepID=A0A8C6WHA8_9GOBI